MKVHISALLKRELKAVGLEADSLHGVKEWEVALSLLDSEFWSTPDEDEKRRVALSKACAHAEQALDFYIKEFWDALKLQK